MAFNLKRFGKTSTTGNKVPLIWTYDAGGDSLADCAQSGYFNDNKPNLDNGHLIYINKGPDYSILRIVSMSPDIVTEVIFPQPKTIIAHGLYYFDEVADQDTFSFEVPGVLNGDTAFVQVFSGALTSVRRVQAYDGHIFFHLADPVSGHFNVNYLVLR